MAGDARLSEVESSPRRRVNKETRLPVGIEMRRPERNDDDDVHREPVIGID